MKVSNDLFVSGYHKGGWKGGRMECVFGSMCLRVLEQMGERGGPFFYSSQK